MIKSFTEFANEANMFHMNETFSDIFSRLSSTPFTWDEFTKLGEATKILPKYGFGGNDVATNTSIVQVMYHLYAQWLCDGRTYELSPGMAEMFLYTNPDIDSSLLMSPFFEIELMIPPGMFDIYAEPVGYSKVHTIMVNLCEKEGHRILRTLLIGTPSGNIEDIRLGTFYFKLELEEGKVSECLAKHRKDWTDNPMSKVFGSPNDNAVLPKAFQLVVNTLLYLTSPESDVRLQKSKIAEMRSKLNGLKNLGKRRKLAKKMEREASVSRYLIGGSMTLTKEERTVFSNYRDGKHSFRYPVGGHWRAQWYGPKEARYQKPKFIRPHSRGPEFADYVKSIGLIK